MMQCIRSGIKGIQKVAIPIPTNDQYLVRIQAAGVNRPDLLQNKGLYPARPGMTDILGLEIAGTVVDQNLKDTGIEICALLPGGGYSEYCVVNKNHCLPIPFSDESRFIKAAALPETCFTVWKNLFWNGKDTLRGKRVFVHGGSSGIGTTAIQMCKQFGANHVAVSVRDQTKKEFCMSTCNADEAFLYGEPDWENQQTKYDVVLDMVGGDYLGKNLNLLDTNGRLVIIGFLKSPISANVNMTRLLLKSLTITGSVLRSSSDESKAVIAKELEATVWPELRNGNLRLPFISDVLNGIDSYEKAFEIMSQSSHMGKIVMKLV